MRVFIYMMIEVKEDFQILFQVEGRPPLVLSWEDQQVNFKLLSMNTSGFCQANKQEYFEVHPYGNHFEAKVRILPLVG